MKKGQFTGQQTIGFLKEAEAGCRWSNSPASTVAAMQCFAGVAIEVRDNADPSSGRLCELAAVNAKLMKLLAAARLDVGVLKAVVEVGQ